MKKIKLLNPLLALFLTCVLALMPNLANALPTNMPDIVGGIPVVTPDYPSMVSLRASGEHICGASLIAPQWVLTAAHCVDDSYYPVTEVWIGLLNQKESDKIEKLAVEKIFIHDQFKNPTVGNDVALIKLKTVAVAPLMVISAENIDASDVATDPQIMAEVIGWGSLKESDYATPDVLQSVQVPLISQSMCNSEPAYNGKISESMLCAGYPEGGKDSCQGDSGGPLLISTPDGKKQIGIVSWGQGCARPMKFGVYTRLSLMKTWIDETIIKN